MHLAYVFKNGCTHETVARYKMKATTAEKYCRAFLMGKVAWPFYRLVSENRYHINCFVDTEREGPNGIVHVCFPLISLMKDQVDRANAIEGVTAAYKGK